MHPLPQIAPQIKQMRLSGVLDSLEVSNRQAIEAKLAYTDFLALLLQDEIAPREQRQFAQRPRRAPVMNDTTLERFYRHGSPTLDGAVLAELATCRFVFEQALRQIAAGEI
ncbi:MAG: hypothetical protein JNJ60_04610 [Rhodocyclaceae bacterium]|nr:hypothetical protein [Rhodocyclaceae bacterium]